MIHVLSQSNSIICQFLLEMRDKDIQKDRGKFRNNLKRLGSIMSYEISRTMAYSTKEIETPISKIDMPTLAAQPVIIAILRAAIPFFNGFLDIFDQADTGFVGAYRTEEDEIQIKLDYLVSSDIENREVIIVDPMLATGKSMLKSINLLMQKGTPAKIHLACAVAAPEGIDYISSHLNLDHTIWVGAIDKRLNDKFYIVPGLGDAGDLAFGSKI